MCLSLQYHTELVFCPNQPLHSHIHPTLPLRNSVSLSSIIKVVLSGKQDNSTLHLNLALEALHGTSMTCFFSLIFHWSFQTFPHTWYVLPLDTMLLPDLHSLLLSFFIDAEGHCIFFLSFNSVQQFLPCLSKLNTTFSMKPSMNPPLLQC